MNYFDLSIGQKSWILDIFYDKDNRFSVFQNVIEMG